MTDAPEFLSPEKRASLRQTLDQATPGPWYPGHLSNDDAKCNCTYVTCETLLGSICTVSVDDKSGYLSDEYPPESQAKANGLLIATMHPENVKAMLDYIEKLEVDNAWLQQQTFVGPNY